MRLLTPGRHVQRWRGTTGAAFRKAHRSHHSWRISTCARDDLRSISLQRERRGNVWLSGLRVSRSCDSRFSEAPTYISPQLAKLGPGPLPHLADRSRVWNRNREGVVGSLTEELRLRWERRSAFARASALPCAS